MNPKRILMISYHTCPLASIEGKESGGMNVYVAELSKSLGKQGYAVDIITRKQETDSDDIIEMSENVRVIHLPAGPSKDLDKHDIIRFIPDFVSSFSAFQQSQTISYDLIHAHYYQSGFIAQLILRHMKKVPLIVTFHTLGLLKNLVARSIGEQETAERIRIEQTLVQEANAIISPSDSDRQYLAYLYGADAKRIHMIPPGVNTDVFHPMDKTTARQHIGANADNKIILFVGRIEPLKGIDTILYAIKILTTKNPHIKICMCIIGGDHAQHAEKKPTLLKQLRTLERMLGISNIVTFIPQKQQDELSYYYNAADVTLLPSHYESFGMSAAESLACGTPVITTNVAGISSTIDSSLESLITTVNNPIHLSGLLERVLTNFNIQKKIASSLKQIRIRSWDEIAGDTAGVYRLLSPS